MMDKLRGVKAKLDLPQVAITLVVLAVVSWVGFRVFNKAAGQYQEIEGPVEFTGPAYEPGQILTLLLLVGLVMVLVGIGAKYLSDGENA